jgi:hypothetical protein
MNVYYTETEKIELRRKLPATFYGMYPGGGFVAWPDGRTSFTEEKSEKSSVEKRCRGHNRKGFVARPSKG